MGAGSLSLTLDFIKIHSARQAVTRGTDVQTDGQANRLTVLLQKATGPLRPTRADSIARSHELNTI